MHCDGPPPSSLYPPAHSPSPLSLLPSLPPPSPADAQLVEGLSASVFVFFSAFSPAVQLSGTVLFPLAVCLPGEALVPMCVRACGVCMRVVCVCVWCVRACGVCVRVVCVCVWCVCVCSVFQTVFTHMRLQTPPHPPTHTIYHAKSE